MLADFYSRYALNRLRSVVRSKRVFNLRDAKRIVVLFDATKVRDVKLVKSFVSKFSRGKEVVTALGYVDDNHKSFDHISVLHFDFFSKGQLSWYGKPKGMVINNFLNQNYDILIDLSLKVHYPLTYLAAAASAKYKVGRFRKDISIFDLKIDDRKNASLEAFIQKITDFLIPKGGYEHRITRNGSSVNNAI